MVTNVLYKFKYGLIYYDTRRAISYKIERLHGRGLVKLTGEDVVPYLQGLITNDINQLDGHGSALYTHFLNNKGRILYDALICKYSRTDLLLECDALIEDDIIKYLKTYRVRKKIDIESFNGNVWSIFDDSIPCFELKKLFCESGANLKYRNGQSQIANSLCCKNVLAFQDPRIPSLGVRVFTSSSTSLRKVLHECGIRTVESNDYVMLRYKLGVPEGVNEIPVGKCFPMEMNCDYLNGVSFQKGCYIGQELTARTYHTGVVRKRVMPLILSSVPDQKLDYDSVVVTEDDQVVGKLKGIYQNYGIALLRITETLKNSSKLNLNDWSAYTYKPFWWPSNEKDQFEKSVP